MWPPTEFAKQWLSSQKHQVKENKGTGVVSDKQVGICLACKVIQSTWIQFCVLQMGPWAAKEWSLSTEPGVTLRVDGCGSKTTPPNKDRRQWAWWVTKDRGYRYHRDSTCRCMKAQGWELAEVFFHPRRTHLLEGPCLCLPEKPLLLLQEFHLQKLLLWTEGVQGGRLQHSSWAPLQHVGQGLFGVCRHKGACGVQPGATYKAERKGLYCGIARHSSVHRLLLLLYFFHTDPDTYFPCRSQYLSSMQTSTFLFPHRPQHSSFCEDPCIPPSTHHIPSRLQLWHCPIMHRGYSRSRGQGLSLCPASTPRTSISS